MTVKTAPGASQAAICADTDPRIAAALGYAATARPRHDVLLPASVLTTIAYEYRRHVLDLLEVITEIGTTPAGQDACLTGPDLGTALAALDTAAEYLEYCASLTCADCAVHPAELCDKHAADLDAAACYRELAARLTRRGQP
jgi:hypothetical protein